MYKVMHGKLVKKVGNRHFEIRLHPIGLADRIAAQSKIRAGTFARICESHGKRQRARVIHA